MSKFSVQLVMYIVNIIIAYHSVLITKNSRNTITIKDKVCRNQRLNVSILFAYWMLIISCQGFKNSHLIDEDEQKF